VSIDIPNDWDLSKVIPGQLVIDPADGEDIAPGVIEVRPQRPLVLAKTSTAAMVVASYTGRAIGLTARGTWTGLCWLAAGTKSGCYLGYRYVRAHDLQEVLGGMSKAADWNKVETTRRSRWRFLGWTAVATATLNVAGWIALAVKTELHPLGWAAALPPTLTGAVIAAAVTLYGRYRLNAPQLAPQQLVADPDNPDGQEPYPLAWVQSGGQAADCLARALFAEGADYRDVKTLARHDWGWEVEVILKGSTPGKVQAAADQMESHMGLPDGGFMIEPDTRDKSRIIVRLVQSNPFADMPRPAVHAPRSLSVHDVIVMGRAMDGSPFELTLDGFCALVIGAMGAGKTLGALRTVNEALTACRDAVVWDLDPIKGGLAEFGDLMARRARTPEDCEAALEDALAYITARGQLLPKLGMGDRWHATEKHPNLYINIDEFIQLSPRGKELAIKILRTGRQYGIYLIMAGQEATADSLGGAVAMLIAYRILMPCRFEDIKIAFGPGAGAQGWRPDRMKPAVGPIANDAGQAMIMGGPFVRAIRYQFNKFTRDQIVAAVPERVAAGTTTMDADTILKAGGKTATGAQRGDLVTRLKASAHGDAHFVATLLQIFDTAGRDFLPTSESLLPALAGSGIDLDATALSTRLRKHAPGAKAGREDCAEGKHLRGWHRAAVEQAAAGLLDPASTRQTPGIRAA
jgi:S-DNA-T family DNA segregation ATPase FtsK/SpoIIIE